MRTFLVSAALLALAACGDDPGASVAGQPTAADEDGLSVSVVSVRPDGDKTVVELVAVNGNPRPATIGREYGPITLVDGSGAELKGPAQTLDVPGYSSDRLRVEFAGRATGERMTLKANNLTIADLPTAATTFSPGPSPTIGSLTAAQANHANGSSVRVSAVTFEDAETVVQLEAVNGHDDEIRLSGTTSDESRLQDQTGRIYPLIPPGANPELKIPAGQVLRGTLRFAGRVPASVQRLTLQFHPSYGGDEEYSTQPKFSIDLPLAAR